jgi:steroid 5-alpha reductase family enzyme
VAALGDGGIFPHSILAALGGLRGLRLALYLWRRVRGKEEDGR